MLNRENEAIAVLERLVNDFRGVRSRLREEYNWVNYIITQEIIDKASQPTKM